MLKYTHIHIASLARIVFNHMCVHAISLLYFYFVRSCAMVCDKILREKEEEEHKQNEHECVLNIQHRVRVRIQSCIFILH